MFFLVITANLVVYLSSLQLLGTGSLAAGGLTLAGGVTLTSLSVALYKFKKEKFGKFKKGKKLDKWITDDCGECCNCDCCGCD